MKRKLRATLDCGEQTTAGAPNTRKYKLGSGYISANGSYISSDGAYISAGGSYISVGACCILLLIIISVGCCILVQYKP